MILSPQLQHGGFSFTRLHSTASRLLLRCCFQVGKVYRIPFGPLKGIRIRYDESIDFHMMLGFWETRNLQLLSEVLKNVLTAVRGPVICDIGGNIGLYSLWFSRRIAPSSRVYAFEPDPLSYHRLCDHIEINHSANVEPLELACTDHVGTADFFLSTYHRNMSSLLPSWASHGEVGSGRIVVGTTSLDEFFFGRVPREGPHLIKMDIEGGGIYALKGASRCGTERRPLIVIESHTPDEDRAISWFVTNLAYDVWRVGERLWVKNLMTTYPDPDGIWGTLFLCPRERRVEFRGLK